MVYDVVIIGGGPAGLSAGLYAGRAKLNTIIIEKGTTGGQIATTSHIENYPGAEEGATGPSLVKRMADQAKEFGMEIVTDEIMEVELSDDIKILKGNKETYKTKAVIVATGAVPKPLNIPGERDFTARGVSYCATCDGPFFQDLELYVIGGGDTAVEEALQLTNFARKVTIIHRRDSLRATQVIQDRAFANEKIDFIWNSQVKEIKGDKMLGSFVIENLETGEETEISPCEEDGRFGMFILIGYSPNTSLFEGKLDMEKGYIKTNDKMETNIKGVFAAGDNRVKCLRQVVTATSDGAIAAVNAENYIRTELE